MESAAGGGVTAAATADAESDGADKGALALTAEQKHKQREQYQVRACWGYQWQILVLRTHGGFEVVAEGDCTHTHTDADAQTTSVTASAAAPADSAPPPLKPWMWRRIEADLGEVYPCDHLILSAKPVLMSGLGAGSAAAAALGGGLGGASVAADSYRCAVQARRCSVHRFVRSSPVATSPTPPTIGTANARVGIVPVPPPAAAAVANSAKSRVYEPTSLTRAISSTGSAVERKMNSDWNRRPEVLSQFVVHNDPTLLPPF